MDKSRQELVNKLKQARAIIAARIQGAQEASYPYIATVRGASGGASKRIGLHSRDAHHARTCARIYAQDRDMVIEELIDAHSGAVISTRY